MKPPLDNIRLTKRSRDQLIRIKRTTGIEHWNIICRWAYCLSLRDASVPPAVGSEKEAGVEISWRIFAGECSDLYIAALLLWQSKLGERKLDQGELCRRHIQRGLSMLDSKRIPSIAELFVLHDAQTA